MMENLSNSTIANLYKYAALFVYPSLYEGFGIPPLEAMSYGIPVIASNKSSIPEVCGDAAHYFDPTSVDSIAEAILFGLSNRDLRTRLINSGFERLNYFRWDRTASMIIDICNRTLS
jgi:glycosyltransferase involved in cell wall biosynthesis